MLTSFNGQAITYDEIGNPLTYRDGFTFTWQNGRRLASVSKGTDAISYTYNPDGIRTSKTVNGTVTKFHIMNGTLLGQTRGSDKIIFLYDEKANRYGFDYNGTKYYYIFNVQGDVIGILNQAGQKIVSYTYDPWGKLLSIGGPQAGTIGQLNPIRYRGYYYDTETGFYYLQSRYYDPITRRFLNADGYISTGRGVLGSNMFAYCNNNPVNRIDPYGHFWQELWNAFTQAVQQASGVFALAGGVTQIDSPVPGPADLVGAAIAGVTLLVCAGIAIYTVATTPSPTISVPKAEEKDITVPPPSSQTVIYRYGGTNPGNLTPKEKDKYTGLSFSTVPKPGAAMTTIEALNATGVVYAVKDGATHVSVKPIGGTMEDWINAGSSSHWTQAVKSVVIKWDGES